MSYFSFGDMAQTQMLNRRSTELKQQIHDLTQELTTGRTANVPAVLSGDYSYLIDIENNMQVLEGYRMATNEASTFALSMQTTLEHIQTISSGLSTELLASGNSNIPQVIESTASQALGRLNSVVSALNTQVAGRSLFAGIATNTAPVIDSTTLLDEARIAVTGAIGPADIRNALQAWFDDPLGFDAIAYQGSDTGLSPFQLGKREQASLDVRANDPAIRDVLRNTILAAISTDTALGLDMQGQAALMKAAGVGLLNANNAVTGIRAEIGAAEARIDQSATRNAAEKISLEMAKGALLGIDQYETATRLEDVQFQLESLYSVTVRLSRLSLLNFMQ